METKKSKLHLRKEVVARLNSIEMTRLHGGGVIFPTDAAATCFSPTTMIIYVIRMSALKRLLILSANALPLRLYYADQVNV